VAQQAEERGPGTALARMMEHAPEQEGRRSLALLGPGDRETIRWVVQSLFSSGPAWRPKHIDTEEKAVVTMLAGLEVGLPPIAAMNQIYVVNGRPTMMAQAQLALIMRSGMGYYVWGKCDDTTATITGYHYTPDGRPPQPQQFTFTIEQAQSAGLTGKDGPVWKLYPGDMLRWKAAARMARGVFPDVVLGLYAPDELGAPVRRDEHGELVVDFEVLEREGATPATAADAGRSVIDAEFSDEGAAVDFEGAGAGRRLDPEAEEEEEDPQEAVRQQVRKLMAGLDEQLADPAEVSASDLIEEDPVTAAQLGAAMQALGIPAGAVKSLKPYAQQQLYPEGVPKGEASSAHLAVWERVCEWWQQGTLLAHMYLAACEALEVEPGENPFAPEEEAAPAGGGTLEL